jgi:nucleotide-binding universal stress UspA family protein
MMKRITFAVDEQLLEELRALARDKGTTVNQLFREWTDSTLAADKAARRAKHLKAFQESLRTIDYVKLDRKYTREEMNQR